MKDEPGPLRASSGASLFLDEIGEFPAERAGPPSQRVLQEKEVLPVGGIEAGAGGSARRGRHAETDRSDQRPSGSDLYPRIAAFDIASRPCASVRATSASSWPIPSAPSPPSARAEGPASPDPRRRSSCTLFLNFRELGTSCPSRSSPSSEDLLRQAVGDAPPAPKTSKSPEEPAPSGKEVLRGHGKHSRAPRELTEDELS